MISGRVFMTRLVGVSVLVSAMLFTTPLHAADEIRIVYGTLFQPLDSTGVLSVEGTSGVRINAALSSPYATPRWKDQCYYHGCLPGDVVSLRVSYGALRYDAGSGQFTLHGRTYSLWTPADDAAYAILSFDGAFVVPDLTEGVTAQLSAPFAFSGFVEVPNRLDPHMSDVFELHGSGVATVTLYPHFFADQGWIVGSITYEFTPRGNTVTTPH
jgi:hypothetical protein